MKTMNFTELNKIIIRSIELGFQNLNIINYVDLFC